jgi:hypothetical protein
MAAPLSQFSDVQLLAVYRCIEAEIFNEAQAETSSPLTAVERLPGLLRLPRRLIDEVIDFNSRHAEACIEKLRQFPGAGVRGPWDAVSEETLTRRVTATVHRLAALLVKHWGVSSNHAAFFAGTATDELRQRICEEYEIGRDAHSQAIASLRCDQTPATPGGAGPTAKKRRRSGRKAPTDKMLAILERRAYARLRRDFPDPHTLEEKMVAEIWGLSAADLKALVNEELESQGIEPVSAKTISRSEKYKSWKRYRRHMVSPASTAADCGPAFTKPGYSTPTTNDVADAAVMASGLAERSERRLRSNSGSRSEHDRAADEWAKSAGAVLPPAD